MSRSAAKFGIRGMTTADLGPVIAIAENLHYAPHWTEEAYLNVLNPESKPPRIALVAEEMESGAVVGFSVAGVVTPQAELETIAVAASHRRSGVGRQMLAAMIAELGQVHVREVLLEVRPSNQAALGLYQAFGFYEAGRRPRYYVDPLEDALLMAFWLP
jgi:ribosomal-protein-alanine N-acetyltransferase